MKTLLIFIVLLTITGCASTNGISRYQERQMIMEQAKIDRESGKITSEQYQQIMTSVINSIPAHDAADLADRSAQLENSRIMLENGARLMGGGGFGYNQPVRMQTTCTQIGMFTQCW
jgi:hypothetical protein